MIDVEQLKKNTLIHLNVDSYKLSVIIDRAKFQYLRQVLGADFYDHLNTAGTFTTDEQKLVDTFIYPFVTVCVEMISSVHLNWEIRNKNVGTSNDQYQNATNWNDNNVLVNDLKQQQQMYKDALVDYLEENQTLFPLYKCVNNDPLDNSFSSSYGIITNRR